MRTLLALAMLLLASIATADITVICTTPTTNADGTPLTDLAGIRFHHRLNTTPTYSTIPSATIVTSTTNTDVIWTLVTSQTVTYCFVAYAYDTSGNLSGQSNEVCKRNEDRIPPAPPALRISTMLLGPTTYASTTVGGSRYKAISATNNSPSPVTITAVELLGPDPDFRMATYTLPRTVDTLKSTSFRVYFEPIEKGTRYSIFRVTTNAGQQDVPLSGIGKM